MTFQTKPKDKPEAKLWPNTYRNTFGLIDPRTKSKYKDIVTSFLDIRLLYSSDLEDGEILEPSDSTKSFILLTDQRLIDRIRTEGFAKSVISFQIRLKPDLNYTNVAVARLYESHRTNLKNTGVL